MHSFPSSIFLAFICAAVFHVEAFAGASIEQVAGSSISYASAGTGEFTAVLRVPKPMKPGDRIRTGPDSSAVVVFDDGSKAVIGATSDFTLEEHTGEQISMNLVMGVLRNWVSKIPRRRFKVKTPTAVCSVRGTEFKVQVYFDGRTLVDLYKGLLGVSDSQGKEFTLRPGERLELGSQGVLGPPHRVKVYTTAPPPTALQARARREVGLDMSKEDVLCAAARELKLAEYQQGKALVDVNGYRVRLEEYVFRPQADQFKLVVLNERESRFDYFYYLGTFNKALPTDLSSALRQMNGTLDAPPDYWLTSFETGRSNTQDSLLEKAQNGHLVDVNNNGVPDDAVAWFFDSGKDQYVDAMGRSVYQTLFDKYGFYVNGILKYGWTGANLQTYTNKTDATVNDPFTGAALARPVPVEHTVSTIFPDATQLHQQVYESFGDGTSITWDNYIIDNEGKVGSVSDFDGVTTGAGFKQKILGWNYEQVVTATEFQGRKIDLVVEPKILIQTGLMK
ncbi:MAG: FecR domain-containing protein [Elusimicrobia bacterium]|nr:FecR domain-containing protein [Elusimicrobiota bacterium]